jgi:hypothetical protein
MLGAEKEPQDPPAAGGKAFQLREWRACAEAGGAVWRASRAEYTSRQAIAVVAAGLPDSKLGAATKWLCRWARADWREGLLPRGRRLPFRVPATRILSFQESSPFSREKNKLPFFFGSRGTLPLQRPVYIVDRCLHYQSKGPMGLQAHADYDLRSRRLQSTSSECGEAMSPSSRLHKSPLQRANNVSVL